LKLTTQTGANLYCDKYVKFSNIPSWTNVVHPAANAGPDQNVATGSTVTLHGSGTPISSGDSMTYYWMFTSKPAYSTTTLSDRTAATPTFFADVDGTYKLILTVTDGSIPSLAAAVTITATSNSSSSNSSSGLANSSWAEFGGNNRRTGLSSVDTSANNGTLKWRYQTGGAVDSSPAIRSDGTIYFGSDDDSIYALTSNGTLKWKYQTGNSGFANAVFSSPAIGPGGTIYIGSNGHNLYAIGR
jgi:outer membrane protein assembly factor BamB